VRGAAACPCIGGGRRIVEPAREFVPRRVGVEKPTRERCPNDLLGTNCPPVFPISARFSTRVRQFSTCSCG